ncbi:Arylamine N-acetyltransferase 1 [Galemys pyrenaicus]|uniref:Arylamine N-acetyltransferase 1 n=2 Tax=Boreoeutheria TaxID=1437010 RepID=A0A8J6A5H9_GALPY|nr:Arylamine N-acetyltransferase 1 [Galemys pyrenaicus]
MDIEAYFERIGYKNSRNKLDLETLTDIFQHHIRAIPFENIHMLCGETVRLDLETAFDQVVRKKHGGWCLQVNHLLYWVLTTMGFDTTMLGGCVYNITADRYSNSMIHLLLKVTIDGTNYIVDAGFGRSYQMWQPLELISGKDQPQVPCIFCLTEENGIWYLDQIRIEQYVPNQHFLNSNHLEKRKYQKLFSFTLEPRTIKDFESANAFLQASTASEFLKESFCSLQTLDGVYCLLGFTLAYRKFNYKDNMDLVEFKTLNEEEIEEELKNTFNISLEKKIGYKNSRNKLDLETLTDIFQHHIRAIPFENIHMLCGETVRLDLETAFDQVVRKKHGGWCLQVNHLLYWVLTTMGFDTTMLGGCVYNITADRYSNSMIHLLLKVTIDGTNYIVDAGFGRSYQMWQPLELISGKDQPQVPCIFRLTEENGIWYLDQIRREQYVPNQHFLNSDLLEKGKYRKIYSFTLEPRTIEDFQDMNTFLQTSPASVFTSKSFCSLQTFEGVHCLVGFTLTYRKFNYKDNMDLVEFKTLNEEEIEEELKNTFNISLEKKLMPKHGDRFFTI